MYHSGGNRPESALFSFKLRRDADLALRACVIQTGSDLSDEMRRHYDLTDTELLALYETIGDLMYRAVRLGGIPCTEASWRWGYGWPKCGQVSGEG